MSQGNQRCKDIRNVNDLPKVAMWK